MTIIDTDILIDAGREIDEAVTCLDQMEQHDTLGISIITQMELVVGCRNKTELTVLDEFVARFYVAQINESISHMALDLLGRYRLSHGLLIADALIAATAIDLEYPFITKNQRHYRFIPELQLLSYPEPDIF